MKYLFLLFLFFCFSCSSAGDSEEGEKPEARLVLSVDKTALFADNRDSVSFSVLDEAGREVTADCKFQINGDMHGETVLKTGTAGVYKIVAKREMISSNEVVVTAIDAATADYVLTTDRTEVMTDDGDMAILTLKTKEGVDVTSLGEYYTGETKLTGQFFSTTKLGEQALTAKVNGKPVKGEVKITGVATRKLPYRLLVEDFTSVKCKFCPQAMKNLKQVMSDPKGDKIVLVGSHLSLLGVDPLTNINGEVLGTLFGVRSLPTILANRGTDDFYGSEASLPGKIQDEGKVGISVVTKVNGDKVEVKAKIGSTQEYSNLYVSTMLVEDGIVAAQLDQNLGNVPGYVHDCVLRDVAPQVKSSPVTLGQVIETLKPGKAVECRTELSLAGCNPDKCRVIVVVGSASLKAVRGVQQVKVGQATGY